MISMQIGDYKIIEPLGVGTVGTVYRARRPDDEQIVALKILLPQVSSDDNISNRFRREISILEKLHHRNIVRHYDDGKHEDRLYYVMEMVDASSLKKQLEIHQRLPWPQVCRYAIQICSALQYAHNHGIVHRDLKPANLLIDDRGQIKLGDFGIARDIGEVDLTDEGLTVGTYAYMSPEQISGEEGIGAKTDLYALGCLLYEMLTGGQPFKGKNFAQIFKQHLQDDPPRVREAAADCPQRLEALIVELMAKDPDQRPFNARSVQGLLQDLLEKEGSSADLAAPKVHLAISADPSVIYGNSPATAPDYSSISWTKLVALIFVAVALVGAACLIGLSSN